MRAAGGRRKVVTMRRGASILRATGVAGVLRGCCTLACLLGLAGCFGEEPVVVDGGGVGIVGSRTPLGPFAPTTMRVFPLTNIEVGHDGVARIALHLELRDRWGDTVKATGGLRVRLYRSVEGVSGPAGERQELVWDVDLNDLGLNAALFDPATRTYRIVLGELPPWAAERARRSGVTLVAVLITRDADGGEVSLSDVYRLEG